MENQHTIQECKQRLPLPQLMANLGFGEFSKRSCRCPFHEDQTASFSVFPVENRWGWKCHAGCGEGDEVDFIKKAKGVDTREAIRLYRELVGGFPVSSSAATPAPAKTNSSTEPVNDVVWQRCVEAFDDDAANDLSVARGYSLRIIYELKSSGLIGLLRGRIAFPIHGHDGKVVGIHHNGSFTGHAWQVAGVLAYRLH